MAGHKGHRKRQLLPKDAPTIKQFQADTKF